MYVPADLEESIYPRSTVLLEVAVPTEGRNQRESKFSVYRHEERHSPLSKFARRPQRKSRAEHLILTPETLSNASYARSGHAMPKLYRIKTMKQKICGYLKAIKIVEI